MSDRRLTVGGSSTSWWGRRQVDSGPTEGELAAQFGPRGSGRGRPGTGVRVGQTNTTRVGPDARVTRSRRRSLLALRTTRCGRRSMTSISRCSGTGCGRRRPAPRTAWASPASQGSPVSVPGCPLRCQSTVIEMRRITSDYRMRRLSSVRPEAARPVASRLPLLVRRHLGRIGP